MIFDPNRTDYAPNEQASIDAWRPTRGIFDAKIAAGKVSAATAALVPAFATLDPIDPEEVNDLRDQTVEAIESATGATEPLDADLVSLYNALAAMATALAGA